MAEQGFGRKQVPKLPITRDLVSHADTRVREQQAETIEARLNAVEEAVDIFQGIGEEGGFFPLSDKLPRDVSSANKKGVGEEASRYDHQHRGVRVISKDADAFGDIVFSGDGVVQTGNSFAFDNPDPGSGILDVGSANAAGTSPLYAREDHVHEGVHSIGESGGTDLHGDVELAEGANIAITQVGQTLTFAVTGSVPAVAHDLLSATHGDTLAAAVVRGSIITGNSTPAWAAMAIGATKKYLRSDGTDARWEYVNAVVESAGPTVLDIGAVADGQYLSRSGTSIIGVAAPASAKQLIVIPLQSNSVTVNPSTTITEVSERVVIHGPYLAANVRFIFKWSGLPGGGIGATGQWRLRDQTNGTTLLSGTASASGVFNEIEVNTAAVANIPAGDAEISLEVWWDLANGGPINVSSAPLWYHA